jgi:hypothetical protein
MQGRSARRRDLRFQAEVWVVNPKVEKYLNGLATGACHQQTCTA